MVEGAKHSVLLDFKNAQIFRVNSSARSIIKLIEKKLTVAEVVERLKHKFEASEITSFISDLQNKEILYLDRVAPKPAKTADSSPRLDMLWIEVTAECNLHCIHCYAARESKEKRAECLSTREIEGVIDEASIMGCHDLQFTGGEATLRGDLKVLINHAKSKNFEVEVFTNGTNINESLVHFFSEKSVNVAMSIYSYKAETHDAITQVPGSHEHSIKSLKLLRAHGVPVRCSIVALKMNEGELEETISFLSHLGARIRLPDPVRPSGRGKGLENWPEHYGLKFLQTKPTFVVIRELFERNRLWNSCWFGKAAVTSEGDVLPCVFARDQIVGNIRKNRLVEIVNGKDLLSLWRLTKDHVEVCRDCEYRYVCEDCRPWAYGFTDNLCAKSPRCTYNPYAGEWVNVDGAPCQPSKRIDSPTSDRC